MMLFRRADGRCVLHTGDFRFTPDMLSGPELRTAQIDTVHLDATYGHPRYSFPPQQATVDLIARLAVERLAADAASGTESTLVVVATYVIGKENVFLGLARALGKRLVVDERKRAILAQLELPDVPPDMFTTDTSASPVHVTGWHVLGTMAPGGWRFIPDFSALQTYLDAHRALGFTRLMAFVPTGWTWTAGGSDAASGARRRRRRRADPAAVPSAEDEAHEAQPQQRRPRHGSDASTDPAARNVAGDGERSVRAAADQEHGGVGEGDDDSANEGAVAAADRPVTPLFRRRARPGENDVPVLGPPLEAAPARPGVDVFVGPVGASCEQSGPFTVIMVPYSEHSSFPELREFVAGCRPARIFLTAKPPGQNDDAVVRRFQDLLDRRRSHSLAMEAMWKSSAVLDAAGSAGARGTVSTPAAPGAPPADVHWVCPTCGDELPSNAALNAHLDLCLTRGDGAGASSHVSSRRDIASAAVRDSNERVDRSPELAAVDALGSVLPASVPISVLRDLMAEYKVKKKKESWAVGAVPLADSALSVTYAAAQVALFPYAHALPHPLMHDH